MKKKMTRVFGKEIYLLGRDVDGINYWLEEPSWNCDWYWGFGYVRTYTNNNSPERSRDIVSHQQFGSLFLKRPNELPQSWHDFFKSGTPLSNEEIWSLMELMKTAYTLREVAGIYHRGGSHISENPCKSALKNAARAQEINQDLLPTIFEAIKRILTDSNENWVAMAVQGGDSNGN